MISSIVFVNAKGEILIYRIYKDDITRADTLTFCAQVVARRENKEIPIVNINGATFIHITCNDTTLIATTRTNVNAIMIIKFLYAVVDLYKAYFGGEFNEDHVRKHFVLIYELLDEVMDYGVPQLLEPDLLKQYIMEGGIKRLVGVPLSVPTGQLTVATGVRFHNPNILYKKNEVYLDVIESVNVIFSNQGTVLKSDVNGQIILKTYLSGIPECKIGLNDRVLMEKDSVRTKDVDTGINVDYFKFHQCVKLKDFNEKKVITFVPPDGVFELMKYRISENIVLPFKLMPIYEEIGKNRFQVVIKLKALYEKSIYGSDIVINVPCPKNTAKANTQVNVGKAKYEPENGGIVWRIKKFQGETETLMRGTIDILETGDQRTWVKPPISMSFQVPMFTVSGMRVRFLKVIERSGYQTAKYIRYITKGGSYEQRV